MSRIAWSINRIEQEVGEVARARGYFPSASDLRAIGRNDLACAVHRYGGYFYWADRIGLSRRDSDSDFGWDGERAIQEKFNAAGFPTTRSTAVKAPYDLLVSNVLRVDVKNANYAEYGSKQYGWYYRIGKVPQADLIVLHRADKGDFYAMPWNACPHTNVTIRPNTVKYKGFHNNWDLIRSMVDTRAAELARFSCAEVA